MDEKQIIKAINEMLLLRYGCNMDSASPQQIYRALCYVINDMLLVKNAEYSRKMTEQHKKQVYYMSMEFLMGTSLRNNLYNLGMEQQFADALAKHGVNIHDLYDMEPDAGLGNGGLGRLAACYMDSASSLSLPVTGFSIRYEFGIFKQKIVDGWQMEFPDDWLNMGDVWINPREDEAVEVKLGGEVHSWDDNGKFRAALLNYQSVMAIPYDMYVSGYHSGAVNKLILWGAKSPRSFDMSAFSRGDYAKALEGDTMAEVISKVLYPADDHEAGKILRLRQQYLLVSASVQSILKKHLREYKSLDNLADKVSIHINDTHPALCVPELMRLLVDEYEYGWDKAWDITCKTLSYTNHTVMSEALERWNESLFAKQLPRIYQIVCEINRRLYEKLRGTYGSDEGKINYMAIVHNGEIRMANLCLAACHKINGVSKLHTEILENSIFHDYYQIDPSRFLNVTNGIAYRRWLGQSNPELTDLLCDLIGDGFLTDSFQLEKLMKYYDDASVLQRLQEIKRANKVRLSDLILKRNGIQVDPESLFDVQIKRLHEYKRQLLNVLQILHMYLEIKANPNAPFQPRTFVFAAKASAGYIMAKQIIQLIVAVSNMTNSAPATRDKLKVIFLEDYNVSLAEMIIPAAEISEQISIAGKEASGTGNMKLMINGAITLGTLDGANVEIHEQVGDDNIVLFGLKASEVEDLWRRGYNPMDYVHSDPELKAVMDLLIGGIHGMKFDDIVRSLLTNSRGTADPYMNLADFHDYVRAQRDVSAIYADKRRFTNMSLVNTAKAGLFSADRAVREYAQNIWNLK
ncbi:MAG TPA: glycogen/starch/alpha-glucan phosphorylase [Candidatus Enterenecus stercoripullorum]|nr:glycogen/starch/alpha-glucan phosphorylase [Candidatus Enterenecus stercoripullorum]